MKRIFPALIGLVHLILVGICCFAGYYFWYEGYVRPDNPPGTFREEDLVGVWKADYRHYQWNLCGEAEVMDQARFLVEWLVLREDRTFHQLLRDRRGQIPDQWAQGTWRVEQFPDGVTRLYLEGGRFFAGAVCYSFPALTGGEEFYFSDQTGHELSFDRGKVLIVGWDKFARKLYLEYPWVSSDPPIIVKFRRVPESEVPSIPTPEP